MNQVFMYILAAVTFALIAIFGYRAIESFLESGEQVEYVQFKNNLESEIKKVYTEYGAIREQKFYVPGEHQQICFVNMDKKDSLDEIKALCQKDQLACSIWQQAHEAQEPQTGYDVVDQNVFLTPSSPVPLKVFRIATCTKDEGCPDRDSEEGYLCIPLSDGSFTIFLEGKGDRTLIYEP